MRLELENTIVKVTDATDNEDLWLASFLVFEDKSKGFVRVGGRTKRVKPPKEPLYNIFNKTFPAGLLENVKAQAKKDGVHYELVDNRKQPVRLDMSADLEWLRDYQLAAIDAVINNQRGILHHATGAGKTESAIGLTKRIPCKWLFMVNQKDLMHQAAERYELRTGKQAGLAGDGVIRRSEGNLMVATFQTLSSKVKKGDKSVIKFLQTVEGLIIDEAHTLPAESFYDLVMMTTGAYWRVGMSGTPFARGDRKSIKTLAALGNTIHRIKPEELIARGLLSRPTVKIVECYGESTKSSWTYAKKDLIVNAEDRNNKIVEIMKKARKPCLVFVEQVDHGRSLLKAAEKNGINAEFVWGDKNTAQRNASIKRLVRTDIDVLICSTIFQTGVDIPSVESIIVAGGGKSVIATIQRVGRAMRVTDTKKSCEVWDIKDVGNKWTERHSAQRIKSYKTEGYEVIKV